MKTGVLSFSAARLDAYTIEVTLEHTTGEPTLFRLTREQLDGVIFLANSFIINDDYMNKKFFASAHSGDS